MSGKAKKILYVNAHAKMSGGEISLLSLMNRCDRRRFVPLLLTPGEGDLTARAREQGIACFVISGMIHFEEYFHWHKIPKAMLAAWRIRRLIRKERVALVHSNGPRVSYMAGLAARLCRVPSVTHVRQMAQSPFESPLKGRLLGFLADEIITVSGAVAESILRVSPHLRSKINIVYNGVDLAGLKNLPKSKIRLELKIGHDSPLIGYAGRISPSKGIAVLVQAVAVVKKHFPKIRALLIGSAFLENDLAFRKELSDMIQRLRLGRNVLFTGFRSDVLRILRELDIVVHPALCQDALPRSLIEAAAAGRPVVASRIGGIPEIIGDNECGILVEPGNPRALAEALLALLKNPKRAAQLGAAGRRRAVKLFSLACHFRQVIEIYQNLLPSDV